MNCLHSGTVVRALTVAAISAALVACSIPKLGPEPSTYVGPGNNPPQSLSDANLQAVTPDADKNENAAPLPGAAMVPILQAATEPGTQPATQGAALPATQTAPATRPAPLATTQPSGRDTNVPVPDSLSVQEAILVALMNNPGLRVDKYNLPIRRTSEEVARAEFDPTVNFALQGGKTQSGGFNGVNTTDSIAGNASITEFLPTGTTIQAGISTSNSFYNESSESLGANLSVTQALLRGGSVQANLASFREAEISTKFTAYELRGQAEQLVADVENAYWDLAYAERQMAIVQNSLDVAERQLADTNARINVGTLAASERPAAEADVALRRENLIDARSQLLKARMAFLQLLTPAQRQFWDKSVNLTTLPFIPLGTMDPPETHVDVALRMRPDVNQAKLQIQSGELEVVRTKNGLLPRLDLFIKLGKTSVASNFGESITDINGLGYSAVVGVQGDWEPINRSAKATYRAAQLSRDQREETLNNLNQQVQYQIRTTYIDVVGSRNKIDATRATRVSQQQKFEVEQSLLGTGKGKSLDVAIANRDLLVAQLSEVQAVTEHLKALVNLYRLEGSLLVRRGLEAPGAAQVADPTRR